MHSRYWPRNNRAAVLRRSRGFANRRPEKIVRYVCLPREITFDGASVYKWRRKSEPQLLSAFSQGALGDAGIERSASEVGKLAGLLHDGPHHRKNIHGAVRVQCRTCRGGKGPMRRIDNDPASGKWNLVRGGNLRSDVGFHVDSDRACRSEEMRLFRRRRHHGVGADNIRKHGARKPLGKFLRPFRISRDSAIAIPDGGCDDPIPGNKLRMQPAGNSKADDA